MSFSLKNLDKTAILSLLKTINQRLKNILKKVYFYVDRLRKSRIFALEISWTGSSIG